MIHVAATSKSKGGEPPEPRGTRSVAPRSAVPTTRVTPSRGVGGEPRTRSTRRNVRSRERAGHRPAARFRALAGVRPALRARRAAAAANGSGSCGSSVSMPWSWTITSFVIESTSARAVVRSTSVTSLSQCDDRRGESSGTGTMMRRRPMISRDRRHHVPIAQDVGSADLVGLAHRLPRTEHTGEVEHRVDERDRLAARLHPSRRHHRR